MPGSSLRPPPVRCVQCGCAEERDMGLELEEISYWIFYFYNAGEEGIEEEGCRLEENTRWLMPADGGRQLIEAALELCRDYLWNVDTFTLHQCAHSSAAPERAAGGGRARCSPWTAARCPGCLHGRSRFRGCRADEWLIIAILLELTRRFPHIVAW